MTAQIWRRLQDWAASAQRLAGDVAMRRFGFTNIDKQIQELQHALTAKHPGWLGFCHNDLQYGNMLMDDSEINMHLIDYEYAGVNPVAYDIANHWCEYAADYHTDTPHVLDYSKFPDNEQQQGFVSNYIKALCAGSKDLKALQQQLHAAALAYVPVSHLMWALWGIIQVHTSDVSFDFEAYARQRVEQFFKTSAQL
eukprot:jgi/Astpho2/8041/e_gw1.00120.154.1_t